MNSIPDELATCDDLPARLAAEIAAGGVDRADGECFAPGLSYGRHWGPAPQTSRPAAVTALLFPRVGRWHVALTVRHAALGKHGGQISLPGGAIDPGETSAAAARRELFEELGMQDDVQLVAELPENYVYVSDFRVTPWLAATRREPHWQPHDGEVERVVELPIEILLESSCRGQTHIARGPLSFNAPCLTFNSDCIWGATSIILGELAGVLRRVGQRSAPSPSSLRK